jgi:hypothetical protein
MRTRDDYLVLASQVLPGYSHARQIKTTQEMDKVLKNHFQMMALPDIHKPGLHLA